MLLVDHGYNASTFSARVTASTNADLYCAITSALATLTGELHGGAPSQVQDLARRCRFGRQGRAVGARSHQAQGPLDGAWVTANIKCATRVRSISKKPRKRLNNGGGSYAIARALEDAWNKVIAEEKPQARIFANVDFYTAPALGALGIPSDEYTCMFACSRMAGWCAHVLEPVRQQPSDPSASHLHRAGSASVRGDRRTRYANPAASARS